MTQIRSGGGTSAAVLAGSLAVFPLLDVLGLLARTHHSGELQVVADGVEARLTVEGGEMLANAGTAADRLFELACLDDAWFTVSSTPAGSGAPRGANRERLALQPLLEQVAPHVAEWQSLIKALPFGAVARMSPAMPGPEAQIRSDQWRILSLIGTGRPVHEVVDVSDGRPLETLRLIQELAQKELIVVELPPAGTRRRNRPPSSSSTRPAAASSASAGPPPDDRAAEPIGADAGAPDPIAGGTTDNDEPGLADNGPWPVAEPGPEAPAMVAARATTTPLTAKRPGAVRTPVPDAPVAPGGPADPVDRQQEPTHEPGSGGAAPQRTKGSHAVAAFMPPPVTPSFWPLGNKGYEARPGSTRHAGRNAVPAVAVATDATVAQAAPDVPAAGPQQPA